MTKKPIEFDLSCIELPAVLFRNHPRFKELVGISPRTMSNKDSLHQGPKTRIQIGRVVGYPREALIDWLQSRAVVFGE